MRSADPLTNHKVSGFATIRVISESRPTTIDWGNRLGHPEFWPCGTRRPASGMYLGATRSNDYGPGCRKDNRSVRVGRKARSFWPCGPHGQALAAAESPEIPPHAGNKRLCLTWRAGAARWRSSPRSPGCRRRRPGRPSSAGRAAAGRGCRSRGSRCRPACRAG